MTCQIADALIEDVLNGEADAEGELGLREHLRQCAECADAWQVAWQVRQTISRCEVPDPGETYFVEATASILSRIRGLDAAPVAAEGSPAVVSARYGPLQVRGVGLALLMALGFLAPALRPCVAHPVPATDDSYALRAIDVAELPRTAGQTADPSAALRNHRPFLHRLRSALGPDGPLFPPPAHAWPPCPPRPLPLTT